MNRKKMKRARPFENLMIVLLSGNPVTKEEIAELLGWSEPRGSKVKGPKIYNVSSYIWDIKNIPQVEGRSIVVRSIRDGKKVTAYQLVNVDDAKAYLEDRGLVKDGKPVNAIGSSGPKQEKKSTAKKTTTKKEPVTAV